MAGLPFKNIKSDAEMGVQIFSIVHFSLNVLFVFIDEAFKNRLYLYISFLVFRPPKAH